VPFHPIIISILFHHYKELAELMAKVGHIKEEKQPNEVVGEEYVVNTGTLDRHFITNKREQSNCNICLP